VCAGDTVFVPAGTVHAIEAGIMLFEIQQKSDLTYRVYDYDRRDPQGNPRELHIAKSLEVSNLGPQPSPHTTPEPLGPGRDLLVRCAAFALERWQLAAPIDATTDPTTFEIFTVIDGALTLSADDTVVPLRRGASVVLPASLGAYTLTPTGPATVLRCYVPA
jgi:mannose-6-phosphate isomerase